MIMLDVQRIAVTYRSNNEVSRILMEVRTCTDPAAGYGKSGWVNRIVGSRKFWHSAAAIIAVESV